MKIVYTTSKRFLVPRSKTFIPYQQQQQARGIVSIDVEPPLDCQVLEKPCTIILMEDNALYRDSWVDAFQSSIPRKHGMSFASVTYPCESSIQSRLEEIKIDLPPFPDAVLVTRGPLSSWSAQLYLESFSLQGLVMVDPILLDQPDPEVLNAVETLHKVAKQTVSLFEADIWHQHIKDAMSRRKLKLEPNSVPMLLVQTFDDPSMETVIRKTSERHSDIDGPYGNVPIIYKATNSDVEILISELDHWVDSIL